MRTSGGRGTCEWWYFDAEYSDGTRVVTIFFTKRAFSVRGFAWPMVVININTPGGKQIIKVSMDAWRKKIEASKEQCDVTIGPNTCRYCDGNYLVHYEDGDIKYDCTMKPGMLMWRPGTGHWSFEHESKSDYFAWFVSQPSAELEATLTIGGETARLKGSGYHDHNWYELRIGKTLNHWYWCRARVGPYTAICCDLISQKKYGYRRLPVFMLAKDGVIISDNEEKITVERAGTEYHPGSRKFIDNNLIFTYGADDGTNYKIEFIRKGDLWAAAVLTVLETLTGNNDNRLKMTLLQNSDAMGFTMLKLPRFPSLLLPLVKTVMSTLYNPSYLRCFGDVRITIEKDGKIEVLEQEGLWEQMFPNKNRDAIIN